MIENVYNISLRGELDVSEAQLHKQNEIDCINIQQSSQISSSPFTSHVAQKPAMDDYYNVLLNSYI